MQREAPEGPNLLATARDALMAEILPKLSGTDAFTARMIANAMAISAREAAQDDAWVAEMRATTQRLTGDAAAPDGQGIEPVELVLAPLKGHVVQPGADHSGQDQDRQQIGNQCRVDAALFAEPGGQ
jgi:hypothetical protein